MAVAVVFGLQYKDFVMIAADQSNIQFINIIKDDEDKILKLSDKLVMAVVGEPGDVVQLYEKIAMNARLCKIRNGYDLGPAAAACFMSHTLADHFTSGNMENVSLLLGGYDLEMGPQLYNIECQGVAVKQVRCSSAAIVNGRTFSAPMSDPHYEQGKSEADAYQTVKTQIRAVCKNINLPNFQVTVVDKEGIRSLPVINSDST